MTMPPRRSPRMPVPRSWAHPHRYRSSLTTSMSSMPSSSLNGPLQTRTVLRLLAVATGAAVVWNSVVEPGIIDRTLNGLKDNDDNYGDAYGLRGGDSHRTLVSVYDQDSVDLRWRHPHRQAPLQKALVPLAVRPAEQGGRHSTAATPSNNHHESKNNSYIYSSIKYHLITHDDDTPLLDEASPSTAPPPTETTPHDNCFIQPNDPIYASRDWDMAPIVIEEYKLIFFTQAKVGCTVWKQLFRRMAGLADWQADNTRMLPWHPDRNGLQYLYHYDRATASAWLTDPAWTKALFVRDPVTRFVSAYLDKGRQNPYFLQQQCCDKVGVVMPSATAEEERVVEETTARRNETVQLIDSFTAQRKQQCRKEAIPAARASAEGFLSLAQQCDNAHWRPQSQRMGPTTTTLNNGTISINATQISNNNKNNDSKYWSTLSFVGHLETAAEDAERLLRQLGAWEAYGANGWGPDGNDRIFARGTAPSHATGSVDKVAQYVTPQLREKLEAWYAEDYRHGVLNFSQRIIIAEDAGVES